MVGPAASTTESGKRRFAYGAIKEPVRPAIPAKLTARHGAAAPPAWRAVPRISA
ncbi:hypothetical protein [Fodinicola feengrottensis]|uniref:hypothetical protein n=1 Tax=Fodinicola feengrottensis TaxID=435914 RepID=UPI0013D1BB10|nr:hypothetical protein [Fodinicola feengrottensis]